MPVSRLFGGLFFTMDKTAAGTRRLSGCRLLSLPVAARVVTDTACPAFGLFPQRLLLCVAAWQTKALFSQSSIFL